MDKKPEDLTQDEMWDDSLLIDSWNHMLDEYKKYHSLYKNLKKGGRVPTQNSTNAKHEPVDDALMDHRSIHAKGGRVPIQSSTNAKHESVDDASMDRTKDTDSNEEPSAAHDIDAGQKSPAAPSLFPPQVVLGSVKDENLKKLLMSWYYAGYYTGLYEGQNQVQTSSQP